MKNQTSNINFDYLFPFTYSVNVPIPIPRLNSGFKGKLIFLCSLKFFKVNFVDTFDVIRREDI